MLISSSFFLIFKFWYPFHIRPIWWFHLGIYKCEIEIMSCWQHPREIVYNLLLLKVWSCPGSVVSAICELSNILPVNRPFCLIQTELVPTACFQNRYLWEQQRHLPPIYLTLFTRGNAFKASTTCLTKETLEYNPF